MKVGTVALVVRNQQAEPILIDYLSDDREISVLEAAVDSGEEDPLNLVYLMRQQQIKDDDEFGNYVEELLSHPFVRPEIQEHGVQWLRSKIRIEKYQKAELEAAKVIANYAFKLYQENPDRKDFMLAGPSAQVRVRIFALERAVVANSSAPHAA